MFCNSIKLFYFSILQRSNKSYNAMFVQLVVSMDSCPTFHGVFFFVLHAKLLLQPLSAQKNDGRLFYVWVSTLNSCFNVSTSPRVTNKMGRKAFKLQQVVGRSGNKPPKVHNKIYSTHCKLAAYGWRLVKQCRLDSYTQGFTLCCPFTAFSFLQPLLILG